MDIRKEFEALRRHKAPKSMGRRTLFKRPCSSPNCPNLTSERYCDDHSHLTDKFRASAAKRGYDARWQKYRLSFLSKNPVCTVCQEEGRVTMADIVDHIIPHKGSQSLFWDFNNHQALCKRCHDRKTASEDMGSWDDSKGLR